MTGKALKYFNAFAKCCPPQPKVLADLGSSIMVSLTLLYSIKHCIRRTIYGYARRSGTKYAPPQPRSGIAVEEIPGEKNMHCEMKRSPRGLAREVRASAARRSPNRPFCVSAILPIAILLNVDSVRDRPECEVRGIGIRKRRKKTTSSSWGTKSHAWTRSG